MHALGTYCVQGCVQTWEPDSSPVGWDYCLIFQMRKTVATHLHYQHQALPYRGKPALCEPSKWRGGMQQQGQARKHTACA